MALTIGKTLQNKVPFGKFKENTFHDVYALDEELNAGAFGEVFKAHSKVNSETYAVKVIEKTGNRDDDAQVIYEAKIMRDMNDQQIRSVVRLVDFYVDDKKMYLVQEFAKGGDVFDRIVAKQNYNESHAKELARVILLAIHSLHTKEVVHRDLKPENILLRSEYDDTDILLCDFGSAKYLPKDKSKGLKTLCGTPAFTAPELILNQEYREEVDMWSLGCVLFMVLGGYLPFDGDNEFQIYENISCQNFTFEDETWDAVSEEAKQFINQLLVLDSKKRWTALEALDSEWFVTNDALLKTYVPSEDGTLQVKQEDDFFEEIYDDEEEEEEKAKPSSSRPSLCKKGDLQKSQRNIAKYVARRKLKAAVHVVKLSQLFNSYSLLGNANRSAQEEAAPNPVTPKPTTTSSTNKIVASVPNLALNTRNKIATRLPNTTYELKTLELEEEEDDETMKFIIANKKKNQLLYSQSNPKPMYKIDALKLQEEDETMKFINANKKKNESFYSQVNHFASEHTDVTEFTETEDCTETDFLHDSMDDFALEEEYYSLEELQKQSIPGLDYKNREKYLNDKDFEKVFGASRTEVATWKPWKVTRKKRFSKLW